MQLSPYLQPLLLFLLLLISVTTAAALFGTDYESLVCCNKPIRKRTDSMVGPRALYNTGSRNGYIETPPETREDALRTLLKQAEVMLATRDDSRVATDSPPRDPYTKDKSIIDYILDMNPREMDGLIRGLESNSAPFSDPASYNSHSPSGDDAFSQLVTLERRAEHAQERSKLNSKDIFTHSLLPRKPSLDLPKDRLKADLLTLLNYDLSPRDILNLVDQDLSSQGIRPSSYSTSDLSHRDLLSLVLSPHDFSLSDLSSSDLLPSKFFSVSRRQIGPSPGGLSTINDG